MVSFELTDKIADGAVTAGVALAVNQILINPLPAQALATLNLDEFLMFIQG